MEVRFLNKVGLALIPYFSWVRYFLNSLPINSDNLSYIISIGREYLVSHAVSTNFLIVIACLLSYYIILNHPVVGLIVVTYFRTSYSLFPYLCMVYVPIIISTIFYSAVFRQLNYLSIYHILFEHVLSWKVSQLFTYFWVEFLSTGQ